LNKAKFLWHPALKDNGTYSVIEAAYYGIPSLSSAYPPMHFLNEKFQLNLMFFDAENPREMAEKLKKMEEDYEQRVKILPTREFLEQFSYKNVAPCFWKNLSRLL
jgi:glycosyltransferase involved in cell wall biosynthesis